MRCWLLSVVFLLIALPVQAQEKKVLRAGIIGLDTSHVVAFTKVLNDPKASGELAAVKVVAAYKGGSPDVEASRTRIDRFTKTLRDDYNIEIVDSIPELLKKVDVVLLESVDGRPHLQQAIPVLKAGKPMFIDKPLAGSLEDAIRIYQLAAKYNTPIFSSSSLRFSPSILSSRLKHPKLGKVNGCVAWSPCSLEEHHPDLFWYGIHGVETLFTIMGPGCEKVSRTHTTDTDVVTGVWNDGRVGTFRGLRKPKYGYGALLFCEKGIAMPGRYEGYKPLLREICKFFKTGKPPVSADETLQIYAFMAAADLSKKRDGAEVSLAEVIKQAKVNLDKSK